MFLKMSLNMRFLSVCQREINNQAEEERTKNMKGLTCKCDVLICYGEEAESVAEQWKECNRLSRDLIQLAHKHLIR